MIPIFKTQYSIGKSLLSESDIINLTDPKNDPVYIVDDSFYGFRKIAKKFTAAKRSFVFGVSLPVSCETSTNPSKLIFLAKNDDGVKEIRKLYSQCYCSENQTLNFIASEISQNVQIVVPFYDSFIYKNIFNFGFHDIDFGSHEVIYMSEENDHPFDFQIQRVLDKVSLNQAKVKTICYEKREDFVTAQAYRALTSRTQGKQTTFSCPQLDGSCSEEFCWESYLEQI
jgi:hypothetical protein